LSIGENFGGSGFIVFIPHFGHFSSNVYLLHALHFKSIVFIMATFFLYLSFDYLYFCGAGCEAYEAQTKKRQILVFDVFRRHRRYFLLLPLFYPCFFFRKKFG
jgi:hypothetical protein